MMTQEEADKIVTIFTSVINDQLDNSEKYSEERIKAKLEGKVTSSDIDQIYKDHLVAKIKSDIHGLH